MPIGYLDVPPGADLSRKRELVNAMYEALHAAWPFPGPQITMQEIAAEMKHSETAFARSLDGPPELSTRFSLRWFTPQVEVPATRPLRRRP